VRRENGRFAQISPKRPRKAPYLRLVAMPHRYAVLINVIFYHMPASCDFHATLLKMNIYQLDKLTYFSEYVSGQGQTISTLFSAKN